MDRTEVIRNLRETADALEAEPPPENRFDPHHPAMREALVKSLKEDEGFRAEFTTVLEKLDERGPALVDLVENEPTILKEAAIREDGTATIKLIRPGWGSSGHYSPQVLERDMSKAFPAGTKMFWDHPTMTQEREQPEGSLTKLAAETLEPARYLENGPDGPGAYARAKVFSQFRDRLNDLAPHIGTSIRYEGTRSAKGTAEGRTGPIVTSIERGRSVDFVTMPGAGGKVLEMFEAAGREPRPVEGEQMDDLKEAQDRAEAAEKAKGEAEAKLKEAQDRADQAETAAVLIAAKQHAEAFLADAKFSKVPGLLKARVISSVEPSVKEGKLDTEAFDKALTEAVDAERKYLAELSGSGKVTDLGGSESEHEVKSEEIDEGYKSIASTLGMDEKQAEVFTAGRG